MQTSKWLLGVIGAFLSVIVCAGDVEEVRGMSDTQIEARIQKGDFSLSERGWMYSPIAANQKDICEWVEADRRAIITKIILANKAAVSSYPLLACSLTEEAYRYWQLLGASNGRLGPEEPLRARRWGRKYNDQLESLVVAAGNLNVASVALHLRDGVSVSVRGGDALETPIGAALRAWEWALVRNCVFSCSPVKVSGADVYEKSGFSAGIVASNSIPAQVAWPIGGEVRATRADISSALQVVRLLLEAGASFDVLTGRGYMAENDFGYSGWRVNGETYRKRFIEAGVLGASTSLLFEAEVYAKEIVSHVADCKNWNMDACRQVLAKADAVSPSRAIASRQIAAMEKKNADWNLLVAKQPCKMQVTGWVYTGTACQGDYAQGRGSAERWWSGERFSGQFEHGSFVAGLSTTQDGQRLFEGRFNADGSYASGKLYEAGQVVYEGDFDTEGKRQGSGICWVDGSPEECRYHGGERIDSLHKQRQENQKLKDELAAQKRRQEEQQRRAAAASAQAARDEGGFQWGKLAALGAGAAIGGLKDLPSDVQAKAISGMVLDSRAGQDGVSNFQGALAVPANSWSAGAASPTVNNEAQNRAIAQRCESRASGIKPWNDPQLDTQCQLASFNRCLADAGINTYEKERQQACANLRGVLSSVGGSISACSACN